MSELAPTTGEHRPEVSALAPPGAGEAVDLVAGDRAQLEPSLRGVLNATGVVLHTNLGRAPLAAAAARGARACVRRDTRTSSST